MSYSWGGLTGKLGELLRELLGWLLGAIERSGRQVVSLAAVRAAGRAARRSSWQFFGEPPGRLRDNLMGEL